jgi:chromosome segregation ATPase
MNDYIPISQAAKLLGLSSKTIRKRVIALHSYLENIDSQNANLWIKKDTIPTGFIYLVHKDYLEKVKSFNENEVIRKDTIQVESNNFQLDTTREYIESLKDNIVSLKSQLEKKDNQLEEKDKQIGDLLSRMQESNTIIAHLQNKIPQLEKPKEENSQLEKKIIEEKTQKKGFFARVFGKKKQDA